MFYYMKILIFIFENQGFFFIFTFKNVGEYNK